MLSESLQEAHEQQPQVPQRTYPTARARDVNRSPAARDVNKPSKLTMLATLNNVQQQQQQQHLAASHHPAKRSLRKDLLSKQRLKPSKQRGGGKQNALKLRYVSAPSHGDWSSHPPNSSVDVDNCGLAMKHGIVGQQPRNMEPFSDASSVMRYKMAHPSSQTGTSEFTEDASSTSGSYVLGDEQHATAC